MVSGIRNCITRRMGAWRRLCGVLLSLTLLLLIQGQLPPALVDYDECTMAVIGGASTPDGRPLLWKNRDTSQRLHALEADAEAGGLAWCGIVDADDPSEYWAGINSASFAVANTLPQNGPDDLSEGVGNGELMAIALRQCSTLAEFEALLDSTNQVGRRSLSNFGAFDASGACAIYECYNTYWLRYRPEEAGVTWLVRTNYLDSGTTPLSSYGIDRRLRAEAMLGQAERVDSLDALFLLRQCTTDLVSPDQDHPLLGRSLQETICRRWTRSAAVLIGADENASPGMMLARLGFPAASPPLAVEPGHPPLAVCRSLDAGGQWADLVQDRVEELMTFTSSVCWLHPEDLPGWMPVCDQAFAQFWDADRPLELSSAARAEWCDAWTVHAWDALQQNNYPPQEILPQRQSDALLANAQSVFRVYWEQANQGGVDGRLYNLLGQEIHRYRLGEQMAGERSALLQLPASLAAGLYFLEWKTGSQSRVFRVLAPLR